MISRAEHKRIAEKLLTDGRKVVGKISRLKDEREALRNSTESPDSFAAALQQGGKIKELTDQMDEYGKQAMGIWAQAQVHAVLATIADEEPPQ